MTVSTAITSQGSYIQIATGSGGAKTISGTVGVGNPTTLTSTAHGFENGDVITFSAGFTGANASALNSKTYVVQFKTTNTFAVAEDTTGLTITVGTATATATTYTTIGNVRSIRDLESGSASEIDVSHLLSAAKEWRLGLVDNGSLSMEIHASNADTGQIAARARRVDGAEVNFKVTTLDPTTPVASFAGFVRKFSRSAAVDNVWEGTLEIRVNGEITWA